MLPGLDTVTSHLKQAAICFWIKLIMDEHLVCLEAPLYPFVAAQAVHGNTHWIVKHKGSFAQLFRGHIWKTELCKGYWDETRPEIEKHLAFYKEYLGASRD